MAAVLSQPQCDKEFKEFLLSGSQHDRSRVVENIRVVIVGKRVAFFNKGIIIPVLRKQGTNISCSIPLYRDFQ